jgi:hypothetical protein
MKAIGIKRVTIELTSGTQIVMAPAFPSLPAQMILPDVTGRIGKVLDLAVDDLLGILGRIIDERRAQSQED